jgi:hypothetical protein
MAGEYPEGMREDAIGEDARTAHAEDHHRDEVGELVAAIRAQRSNRSAHLGPEPNQYIEDWLDQLSRNPADED